MGPGVLVGVMPMLAEVRARLTSTMCHAKSGVPVDRRVFARNMDVRSILGLTVKTLPLWRNSRLSLAGSITGAPAA